MKNKNLIILLVSLVFACKSSDKTVTKRGADSGFTIAFGSCNKTDLKNSLWDDVLKERPDVWIWGGDIVYADTENVAKIDSLYKVQQNIPLYKKLANETLVIGTWDDHDYGLNDGGEEYVAKSKSQQVFLDFMQVPANSSRRHREGVYSTHDFKNKAGRVKVIVLDTRYFRTALTPDIETNKRNKPNVYGEGTLLGEKQWQWLTAELHNSTANFNVIVSSIQFLSNKHGFECWGNFPHEVDKLKSIIASSKAKGVIVLSGDRHISEFSQENVLGVRYPLIDFTSSGLTHVYSDFTEEENPYRVGKVVSEKSFGIVQFNFGNNQVNFKMIGDEGVILNEHQQIYN